MTIREARLTDMDRLIGLARKMHAESRYSVMRFGVLQIITFFETAIQSDDYLVLVVEQDGQLVGGFIGVVSPHVFSADLMACDIALYLDPDHRGGMTAARLIKRYTQWSQDKGAVLIQAGITTGVHTDTTARLYERMGYEACGVICEIKGDQ